VFQTNNGPGRYWRLTDHHYTPHLTDCLDEGYPKLIDDRWIGAPTTIRAVFQRDNGKLYFFGDTEYVRFTDQYVLDPDSDPDAQVTADPGYPLPITNFGITTWPMTSVVSGAFQRVNGKIYIFSSAGTYYRITDKYLTLQAVLQDVVDPEYVNGRPISDGWVGVGNYNAVYQRSESDQKIYWIDGDSYQTAIDKYIYVPGTCTACLPTVPEDD